MSDNTPEPKVKRERARFPDAFSRQQDGHTVFVANKKARRVLTEGFDGSQPLWRKVKGRVPNEYRAIELETGPIVAALHYAVHRAGLLATYECDGCDATHVVDDETAEHFLQIAQFGASDVHPGTAVLQ
jgi:hypothetical protein